MELDQKLSQKNNIKSRPAIFRPFIQVNLLFSKLEKFLITFLALAMIFIIFIDVTWRLSISNLHGIQEWSTSLGFIKLILYAGALFLSGLALGYKGNLEKLFWAVITGSGIGLFFICQKTGESNLDIWWIFNFYLTYVFFLIGFKVSQVDESLKRICIKAFLSTLVFFVFGFAIKTLFPTGFPWAQKAALSMFLWVSFLGAAQATESDRHIKVDAIRKAIPEKFKELYEGISDFFIIFFCMILLWVAWEQVSINFNYWYDSNFVDQVFNVLPELPFWVVNACLPYSFAFIIVRTFGKRLCHFWDMKEKKNLIIWLIIFVIFPFVTWAILNGIADTESQVLCLLALTAVCVFFGTPLFVLLGGIAFLGTFLFEEAREVGGFLVYTEKIFGLTTKNVLLAIPFFVISGALMTQGSISSRLVSVARALTRKIPSGMAIATVFACVFFAAISGSSPVTVIAIGSIMVPALIKEGYSEKFSMGLATSAGSLGILIPPSIPMIIYAIVVSSLAPVSIGDLFMAGIGPGLFIAFLMVIYSLITQSKSTQSVGTFSTEEVLEKFREGLLALLLPLFILGGIYSGFFTPTEAACMACIYALFIEIFLHGDLKLKQIPEAIIDSHLMMGSLVLIMVLAFGFNDLLVEQQVPDKLIKRIAEMGIESAIVFLLVLNIFLLFVGLFMDIISAILILAPLIAPIAMEFGLDPLHLGIIIIVNLEVGYLTPPMGLNLFVAASLWKKNLGDVVKAVLPFTAILILGLMLITYIPTISIGPLNLYNGKDFYVPLTKKKAKKVNILEGALEDLEDAAEEDSEVKSMKELIGDIDLDDDMEEIDSEGNPKNKGSEDDGESDIDELDIR